MTTFSELLRLRRAIRHFREEAVPVATVTSMIEDSTLAPSSGNHQPWEFVVVHDRELIRRISDEAKRNLLAQIISEPDHPDRKYREMLEDESVNVFHDAPCLVMILGPRLHRTTTVDCTLAASYLMMSAVSRGLGTCWVGMGHYIQGTNMARELGIPDDCEIVAPVVVGYPREIPLAPPRKPPEILKVTP